MPYFDEHGVDMCRPHCPGEQRHRDSEPAEQSNIDSMEVVCDVLGGTGSIFYIRTEQDIQATANEGIHTGWTKPKLWPKCDGDVDVVPA